MTNDINSQFSFNYKFKLEGEQSNILIVECFSPLFFYTDQRKKGPVIRPSCSISFDKTQMERHPADIFHVSSILLPLCDAPHNLHAKRGA